MTHRRNRERVVTFTNSFPSRISRHLDLFGGSLFAFVFQNNRNPFSHFPNQKHNQQAINHLDIGISIPQELIPAPLQAKWCSSPLAQRSYWDFRVGNTLPFEKLAIHFWMKLMCSWRGMLALRLMSPKINLRGGEVVVFFFDFCFSFFECLIF